MKKHIGWIILCVLGFYLLSVVLPFFLSIATILAWMVPLLMWRTLGSGTCNQALLLFVAGILAILFSVSQGGVIGWFEVFAVNVPLLAMFVAVSFLTLTSSGVEESTLPTGKKAATATALGVHLLGAVINLSVLFVFGDRLQKNGTLSSVQKIILARCFCAAAWWSPFFIATGVALTYAPGMNWKETLIPGVIMSSMAMGYAIIEVTFFRRERFFGYSMKPKSLAIPVFLAAGVVCIHHYRPEINILILICLLSPAASFVFMKGRPRIESLKDFVKNRVASVVGQFALFLAAGVFSMGLSSIIQAYPELFRVEGSTLTPLLFAGVSGLMILIGILGVHPIVSIAIVSPLLIPLHPDHSQLGFLFLTSWAVSTGSSPFSGVGLALVSRYRARPLEILKHNWHYAMAMWALASVVNIVFFEG